MRKTFSAAFIFVVILFLLVLSSCFHITASVPVDSDNDGVADNYDNRNDFTKAPYYDKCPTSTPPGVKVDDWGCPLDADKDAVPDYLDKCPGTPAGVKVDTVGCPLDADKDGVPDYLDKCPGTPADVKVDQVGCPLDSDKDTVPDYLDKCPGTPDNVKVDQVGCPLDADKDTVPDYLDKCPGTPADVKVDQVGCPLDADKDAVPDYLDKCPDTPPGVKVDQNGCSATARIVLLPEPDGKVGQLSVTTAAGSQVLNQPWESTQLVSPDLLPSKPQVMDEKEVRNIFKDALAAQPNPTVSFMLYFKRNSTVLTDKSLQLIPKILEVIKSQKTNHVSVLGHTDTVASIEYNRKLSLRRAKSVADILVSKGADRAAIGIEFYGKEKLLIKTPDGMAEPKNRRVEIIVR